ncbi:hypothetical protein DY000_02039806 [Brassica cretica]|uniref:AT-hook motif nuclear-localized protein n=1 Tax=Brassica cretica TaxID=69181 RepID=A0ABQ7BPE5_BRACR|nr:hypothetical protein DY000_02039806 [Brassica cretica]
MADPARGDVGISNCGTRINVPRVQTRPPIVSSDCSPNFQVTSTAGGVAEQQRHTGGPLGDGTSDSAKTTHFFGGNGSGATPHSGGPITNDVAPLDSVDHCPSMGEAREDGVEDTSGSDGCHGKTLLSSGNNLEIIPPKNEDTGKDDSSAPPSPAEGSEPTSMDVELPPHSFPSKDATLPDDQTRVEKAGSPMVEPNPTFPNVPLGGPHVLISTEEGQTTGNPNPSEVVEKRTSKRLRTLSVTFSPPQPQPKKAKGKGGRKKTGKRKENVQSEMVTLSEVCDSSTTSPTKLTSQFETPTIVGPF